MEIDRFDCRGLVFVFPKPNTLQEGCHLFFIYCISSSLSSNTSAYSQKEKKKKIALVEWNVTADF